MTDSCKCCYQFNYALGVESPSKRNHSRWLHNGTETIEDQYSDSPPYWDWYRHSPNLDSTSYSARGLSVDPAGEYIVIAGTTGGGLGFIVKRDKFGNQIWLNDSTADNRLWKDSVMDSTGNIYCCSQIGNGVTKFNPDGTQLWDTTSGGQNFTLASDGGDYLYVSYQNKIVQFDADGTLQWTTNVGGGSSAISTGLYADGTSCFALQDFVLFAQYGVKLHKLDADGTLQDTTTVFTGGAHNTTSGVIAAHDDGMAFGARSSTDDSDTGIYIYDTDGTQVDFIEVDTNNIPYLDVDSSGRILALGGNDFGNTVLFDTDGTAIWAENLYIAGGINQIKCDPSDANVFYTADPGQPV